MEKKTAQAKQLAGMLYNYQGEQSLDQFWNDLPFVDKFLCFHKLHTILKAGE